MELKSVELPKEDKETDKCCEPVCDKNKWPWGLQLRFEQEQLEVLPYIKDYKVGDRIVVSAEAVITSVRISENKDSTSHSVEMQIEKIACEPFEKKPLDKMSPKEYRKAREEK